MLQNQLPHLWVFNYIWQQRFYRRPTVFSVWRVAIHDVKLIVGVGVGFARNPLTYGCAKTACFLRTHFSPPTKRAQERVVVANERIASSPRPAAVIHYASLIGILDLLKGLARVRGGRVRPAPDRHRAIATRERRTVCEFPCVSSRMRRHRRQRRRLCVSCRRSIGAYPLNGIRDISAFSRSLRSSRRRRAVRHAHLV